MADRRTIRGWWQRSGRAVLAGGGLLGVLFGAAGCPPAPTGKPVTAQAQDRITLLETQVSQLRQRAAMQQETIEAQRQQIARLQELGAHRPVRLAPLKGIKLARLSGTYDENGDGIDDGIVVYVQPVDQDGDVIKAAGDLTVRVFDLSAPAGPRLVMHKSFSTDDLRKLWSGRFLTDHYTVRLPWPENYSPPRQLTVQVEFVDHLTGQKYTQQAVYQVKSTEPIGAPRQ